MSSFTDGLHFLDYLAALKTHYASVFESGESEVSQQTRTGLRWLYSLANQHAPEPPRFVRPTTRSQGYALNAKYLSYPRDCDRRHSVGLSYKGVLHLKSVYDQVLYANLLWEIRPQTVFEFGLLQGGSALWFADQLQVQCGHGEVHGFERFAECVHPTVRHPRLHIHKADLNDLSSLAGTFESANHPWLVVDDAHANLGELLPFLGERMQDGDYLVVEDFLQFPMADGELVRILESLERADFWVDTRYTDAFGYNVTQSPNAWLRKLRPNPPGREEPTAGDSQNG